jgi:hypothetical protein
MFTMETQGTYPNIFAFYVIEGELQKKKFTSDRTAKSRRLGRVVHVLGRM